MTTTSFTVAALDGARVGLSSEEIEGLDRSVQGRLLSAGDEGWEDAVQIWNGMVARTPALVVQPVSTRDVAATVDFARDRGVLLAVKGGGHNIAGTSMAEGGITLDMSRMRSVAVDPAARVARVQAGCLLQDVDRATQEHGLATVLGFYSEVGVAGLTLGGGFGYLARRFGFAVDNLAEVEIVTADGRVRTANRDVEPDLFWGVRGGGGNLGVVTRFTFRLHEVGPMVTGGIVAWSADRADEVLGLYRRMTESAPRELTLVLAVLSAPPEPFVPPEWHGRPVVAIVVCHSGGSAASDLAELRSLADPVIDLVGEMPYTAQQSLLDGSEPKGHSYYWKTEYIPELSDGFLTAFGDGALRKPSPLSQSVLFHLGGALNERDDDDGAVGNRQAQFVTGFAGVWPPGVDGSADVAWVRDSWQGIRPYSSGNYINFQLAEDDTTRTAEAYGANFDRLRRVKAAYDPDNLFRVNRNVPPS